ncbi:MAG: glycosyltransferase [Paludibacteraceae bacterium]|nr:glycosyltransferase [Paludibacteraceae bacterium]
MVRNILTYHSDIGGTIVVDNSVDSHESYLKGLKNITYLSNGSNLGIAAAQNRGIEEAIRKNAKYVLTMDQDSHFGEDSFESYIEKCNQCDIPNVGIFAPVHVELDKSKYPDYKDVTDVMASGSLMSVADFQLIGPFREDFFIDMVDCEYCCRMRKYGKRVITVFAIRLNHHLGNGICHTKMFNKHYLDHPVWRYYYMERNILELMRLYPEEKEYYKKANFKRLKRMYLYDTHHKFAKIRMTILGWWHYKRHKFGQLDM